MANMRREQIQERLKILRTELAELENQLEALNDAEQAERTPKSLPLRLDEYRRYGRQMILPGFGLPGQVKLKQARVLVVGAGGLGSPAMMYLAGAGVGHITVVDDDTVETSNLHRQVLHSQARVGTSKAESAKIGMRSINPRTKVEALQHRLNQSSFTASPPLVDLGSYTLVLDCTDNARTRYLLSDACVHAGVTLVSGGAVGLEGWSGVWNLPAVPDDNGHTSANGTSAGRGPCLRCIYPQSKQDNSGNCEDDGILGTVVGVIGTLMANDAIKLIVGVHELKPCMTLFSPLSTPMFRNIKLRGRKPGCPGCGDESTLSSTVPGQAEDDFCGVLEVGEDNRVTAKDLALAEPAISGSVTVIDVRPAVEFGICAIPNSSNIPYTSILRNPALLQEAVKDREQVYLVCRRGNDSLLVARSLREQLPDMDGRLHDVRGGLQAWHKLDPSFPLY